MKPQMHDGTPVGRPPRRARPPAARIAAAIIIAAMALAAACSSPSSAADGSPRAGAAPASSPAASSTSSASTVAYSQCMRANGVPKYPDPSNGQLPKGDAQHFQVSDSQYQAAQHACQHLLPTGGSFDDQARQCIEVGDCPPSLVQQMLTADRKFAQCMRAHGVPNWPDPIISLNGAPVFKVSAAGITHDQTHNPPMSTKIAECERLDPAPAALA